MKFNKANIKPTLVLGIICLVVAALLAGVNLLTKDVIAENERKATADSYIEALPAGTVFEDDVTGKIKNLPETVKSVIREGTGKGYVVVVATRSQFSKDDLKATVGIDPDGKIVNVKITSYFESKNIRESDGSVSGYAGKDLSSVENNPDLLKTGATYSSTAFRAAITDALNAVKSYEGGQN